MDNNNLLADLRNIHLPAQISIFPLAIGWYILIALILVVISFGSYLIVKYIKRLEWKRYVYGLVNELENKSKAGDPALSDISILLKRVAISRYPEMQPQSLFGEKWLAFLDRTGNTTAFTHGAGRNLLNIYKNEAIDNPQEFFVVIKKWLGHIL